MAKRRISPRLPRPVKCDCCGSSSISLVNNKKLYGRSQGDWPLLWYCHECKAAVACHPKTDIQLGTLADRATRQARMKVHQAFDPLWMKLKWLSRYNAYKWLAQEIGIPVEQCHISWFNLDTCNQVIEICNTKRPRRK